MGLVRPALIFGEILREELVGLMKMEVSRHVEGDDWRRPVKDLNAIEEAMEVDGGEGRVRVRKLE